MVHTQKLDAGVLHVFEKWATYFRICTCPLMYTALAAGFL